MGREHDATHSAGSIHQQRVNYGLNETVVRVPVLEKVRVAKRDVLEQLKPDILGLHGPQWAASVWTYPMKHTTSASDLALTNTLTPKHITAPDFRGHATTHVPVDKHAAATLQRGSPRGPTGLMSVRTDWTPSTSLPTPQEKQAALESITARSLSTTRSRMPVGRPSLVSSQQAFLEHVRARKAAEGVDVQVLEQAYGEEGAVAMQHILTLRSQQQARDMDALLNGQDLTGTLRKRRGRATADDLAAVRALPDEVALPTQATSREGSPAVVTGEGPL